MKELKYINIGEKERPIKFGLNQTILYCKLRGITITQMNEDLASIEQDPSIMRDFLWSALKDGARKAKEEFEYSTEDIADWLEDTDPKEIEKFFKEYTETLPEPEMVTETELKKKE